MDPTDLPCPWSDLPRARQPPAGAGHTKSESMTSSSDLPVIIAGAGPCGLVAALSLKRSGVPFVIYDRASSTRLCSNAGSGIDMAPVAINILENELEVSPEGINRAMRPYEYSKFRCIPSRAGLEQSTSLGSDTSCCSA